MRKRRVLMLGAARAVVVAVGIAFTRPASSHNQYEVWAIDQSDSPGKTYGGTLYIWDGHELESGEAYGSTMRTMMPTASMPFAG